MSRVLVIGCGGVASVAIRNAAVSDVFTRLCIASRTKSKCDQLAADLAGKTATKITTAPGGCRQGGRVIALIKGYQPDLVMNIALPYQDLTIMDACRRAASTIWTPPTTSPEDIGPEWKAVYERCKEKGFSAYFDYTGSGLTGEKFEKAGLIRPAGLRL